MQRGSLALVSRKEGPDVWQFRWSEKDLHGARIQRKRVIGTVERYPDAAAARTAMTIVLAELNSGKARISCGSITVAQLCDHAQWGTVRLSEVRTTEVESWLRHLPLARSTCAKIRNLLSVLFNHACRHELFDRNPIRLVRQGAKRRSTPSVLTPVEIKALLGGLRLRERTLVLLAVSTGLRQSELRRGDLWTRARTCLSPAAAN